MSRIAAAFALFLLMSAFCGPGVAGNETVLLASLEWPPYTGRSLPGQGASAEVARAAFKAVGLDLKIRFYPWMRAVRTVRTGGECIGYFPEYEAERIREEFLVSEQMGVSDLALVEPVNRPVDWVLLTDLAGYLIGTVAGYVNTDDFDGMAAAGLLRTDPADSDEANLRKLLHFRIDLAAMDAEVFRYLTVAAPFSREYPGGLRINPRLLETKGLYLCFRRSPEGERLVRLFNRGLASIDWRGMQEDYLRRIFIPLDAPAPQPGRAGPPPPGWSGSRSGSGCIPRPP